MADRLISADAVLEVLGCFTDTEHGNPHFLNGIATARESVEDAPEAVVRCKECRYFAGEGMYCENNIIPMFDHFYCYYGERGEDGNDPKSV